MNNVLQTLRFPPQMVIFVHVKTRRTMKACTYVERGRFELREKPEPRLETPRDALVRVTLASICTSDLHILHGSVPRAVEGLTGIMGFLSNPLSGETGSRTCTISKYHTIANAY